MRQSIRDHLAKSCFVDISQIDDESSFMETGILDSVGFLEMVAFPRANLPDQDKR